MSLDVNNWVFIFLIIIVSKQDTTPTKGFTTINSWYLSKHHSVRNLFIDT